MGFHNPFLKDGQIRFPDNGSVVRHVEKWAKVRGDNLAYRFIDFSTERDGVERDLHWAEFSVRNKALAARLQQVTQPGDRVAILCPQNLEYLIAFFGTLYAGRIAVPLFDPAEPGHVGRLHAVLDDCKPSAILTTTASAEGVRKFFRSRPANERPRVIAVDAVPDDVAVTWEQVDVTPDTIAYLQYTSGSTRTPTGVQITHLNLATNVVQVIEAIGGEEGDRGVSWLPFFHDMGLITAMVSPMIGHYVVFMTPAAFVRRPGRWIREMARKPEDAPDCEVITVAPSDTLLTAFNRMRSADLAQMPVVDKGKLVGLIDESDLLLHVTSERERFKAPVSGTMTSDLQTLAPSASMQQLRDILDRGLTAVIADGDHFYGLITRFDLLNHLRRTLT